MSKLLGPNGPFLWSLFHNQSQLIKQLQAFNAALKACIVDNQDDVSNATSRVVSAMAQAILMNMPIRSIRVAELESFDDSRDKTEQSN